MGLDYINIIMWPLKYKLLLSISTGFIVFVPSEILHKWMGFQVDGSFKITIGIVFLIISIATIIEIFMKSWQFIFNSSSDGMINKQKFKKILKTLSEQEVLCIHTFIEHEKQFLNMPINDGVIIELQKKGIIQREGQIGSGGVHFPFKISKNVYDFFRENLIILDKDNGKIIVKKL